MTKNPIEQLTSEFEINDAPLSARNLLTRGHVQDEITQISGCAVTTRGRYMNAVERLKNPNERALYLFIQGPNKASLDLAIQKIDEIIRGEQMSGNGKFRNNPHYSAAPAVTSVEKVYVGIENASPGFDLRGKLIGVRGTNLNYIRNETGAIVTLRGKGSLFIDPNLGTESSEPLHLYIEHSNREGLNIAKQLALNLIETLQQEVAQSQPQVIIQPQTQQLQIYPGNQSQQIQSSQIGVYPAQQSNIMNFKPNAPPPQLNIPPPGVHIPPQQGPLVTQPPPQMNQLGTQQQMLLNNSDGQTNNMIITSTPQIVTSVANTQVAQSVYANQNQQIQQIQHQTQPITIQQQPYQQQIFTGNRQNNQNTTVNSINQYSAAVQNDQSNIQDNISTQYQMQSANLQQNTSQIVGLNNVTQLIPNAQVQSAPQMQIVQTGQPLHILSPQGLTMQNQHFVQQQLQPGTLQQINTIQVPTSAPGQVAFQIPIQTQGGPTQTQFLQQQNIQQTSVLLAQQNLQPQTIASMPATQFQLQQQPFQHQIPILPNVQPQAHAGQYVQGQMGVYTSQGLVLVQSNQNLQLSGANGQSVSNFNPQIVSNNQQDLNQSIQTMPVQMNLPPPNVQQLTTTVNVQQNPSVEQQKLPEPQNIVLEQVTNPTNDNVQISNVQRCQTIQGTLNVTQDSVNQQIISANVTGQTLQIQQLDQPVPSDPTNTVPTQQTQITQMQPVPNYPFQQIQHNNMQEQKNVPSYLLMQPIHQTSENSNLLNTNQIILPPHSQNQSTFSTVQTQPLTNTPPQTTQPDPTSSLQQPNQQDQFSTLSEVPQQQQQHQQQQQSQQTAQQVQKSLDNKQQSVDEPSQMRKRKLSDTGDNNEAESAKKSGVGIDQSQTGKCSTTSNYSQKGNLTQQSQPNSGSSPGNQKLNEKDKCTPLENQMQFATARANAMWRNEQSQQQQQQQEFNRVMNPENSRHNDQSAHLNKNLKDPSQTPYHQQSNMATSENWQTTNIPTPGSGSNMAATQWNQSDNSYMNDTHGTPRHGPLLAGRQTQLNQQLQPQLRPSNFNSQKYQYTNPSVPPYRSNYLIQRNQYIQSRRENQNYQYPTANTNYMQNNSRSQQGNWFPTQSGGGWM